MPRRAPVYSTVHALDDLGARLVPFRPPSSSLSALLCLSLTPRAQMAEITTDKEAALASEAGSHRGGAFDLNAQRRAALAEVDNVGQRFLNVEDHY